MVEKIVEQMTIKEKVGQLNQHLYGWQCYQKVDDHYELTDTFKNSGCPIQYSLLCKGGEQRAECNCAGRGVYAPPERRAVRAV